MTTLSPTAVFVKAAISAWQTWVDRSTRMLNELTDEQLQKEIAPGKNRGIYLVGHLAAVNDAIPEILGLGKKDYPELRAIFLDAPDKTVEKIINYQLLIINWHS